LNIVKTGFFVFLKGQKSRNVFANFCYNSYRDDFYISILARSLKTGFIRSNALERVILKSSLHKPKDRQWFEVSEEVTTRKDGFKDLNSWESTERGLRMPEDRSCMPVESQEMTIEPDEAPISGLDPKTF